MSKALERGAGILLPISSLPSPYGIGTMGRDAYDFVDMLKRAGQKYWQVLPIGPTSFGDSPYQSFSAFAGNPYFIDLDTLIAEGLLKKEEVESYKWADSDDEIDYARIYRQRFEVLRKAFGRSENKDSRDYVDFIEENEQWIDDYALYMAIKADHNNREWLAWEPAIKKRKPEAMAAYREKLGEDVEFYKFLQFKFYQQWMPLKEYANRNGISIIGTSRSMLHWTVRMCGRTRISSSFLEVWHRQLWQDARRTCSQATDRSGVTRSMTGMSWRRMISRGGRRELLHLQNSTT